MDHSCLLLAMLAVAITGCKRDEEPPPANGGSETATTAEVELSYSFTVGTAPFDPSASFTDATGRQVRITKLKFYAYGVHLTDDMDNSVGQFAAIMLVDPLSVSNRLDLGEMAPDHVHEAAISFGLDSASSYGFPDQMTAPAPLNVPDMTWMWNTAAGRIFAKLEGFVDADADNAFDAAVGDVAFEYHAIGSALDPVIGQYHIHRTVTAGSVLSIALNLDVSALVSTLGLNGTFHGDGAETRRLLENLAVATAPL